MTRTLSEGKSLGGRIPASFGASASFRALKARLPRRARPESQEELNWEELKWEEAAVAATVEAQPQRPPVGYLVNLPGGVSGLQGTGYDYVMAQNGLFVQAESAEMTARVRLAEAGVRGLEPTTGKIHLPHGRIPRQLLGRGVRWFQETPQQERYFVIRWRDGQYRYEEPEQVGTAGSLSYEPVQGHVAEFHSHGRMRAFFSATDDRDEQGFRIYGVVGQVDQAAPRIALRVGIYGHFQELRLEDVFE